jgi:hypothetical protein
MAFPFRSWSVFVLGLCGLAVMSLGSLTPRTTHAQVWQKTVRLATPIQFEGPHEDLLAALVSALEQRGDAEVRRRPDGPAYTSVIALRDTLIDAHSIGIMTAGTLFAGYRFEVGASGQLEREVTQLHFILRAGPLPEDIPILYVDARQQWVQKFLHNQGTASSANEAAVIPFHRHLEFFGLARSPDTQVVAIDGETVREGFLVRKEALIRQLERIAYGFD